MTMYFDIENTNPCTRYIVHHQLINHVIFEVAWFYRKNFYRITV